MAKWPEGKWISIDFAQRLAGVELLGVRYFGHKMTKEPFITFWSPTLDKFYCDPTHFMLLPPAPGPKE